MTSSRKNTITYPYVAKAITSIKSAVGGTNEQESLSKEQDAEEGGGVK